jgi:hypothetical protein
MKTALKFLMIKNKVAFGIGSNYNSALLNEAERSEKGSVLPRRDSGGDSDETNYINYKKFTIINIKQEFNPS